MSYGKFTKVYDCMLSLQGEWETEEGTVKVDATDILIVAKILQFSESGKKCYLTDNSFAALTGKKNRTAIQKRLKKLEDIGIIKRKNVYETVNGNVVSKRELSVEIITRDTTPIPDVSSEEQQPRPDNHKKEETAIRPSAVEDQEEHNAEPKTDEAKFFQFIREEYNLNTVPDKAKNKCKAIFNGTYEGLTDSITPADLMDLFEFVLYRQDQKEKLKENEDKKNISGVRRFLYELAAVLGHYDEWRENTDRAPNIVECTEEQKEKEAQEWYERNTQNLPPLKELLDYLKEEYALSMRGVIDAEDYILENGKAWPFIHTYKVKPDFFKGLFLYVFDTLGERNKLKEKTHEQGLNGYDAFCSEFDCVVKYATMYYNARMDNASRVHP